MRIALSNVNGDFFKTVIINTPEDLINLRKKYKHDLIFGYNHWYEEDDDTLPKEYRSCEYGITIYDDYLE